MRKLKLVVEALDVESLDVNPPAWSGRGTIRGARQEYQLPPDDTTGGGGSGATCPTGCGPCATMDCTIACTNACATVDCTIACLP
jgi:hypothetical protein